MSLPCDVCEVPDRGGRAYELGPPPPEMPSFQQRRGGAGHRGGGPRGHRGGGQQHNRGAVYIPYSHVSLFFCW